MSAPSSAPDDTFPFMVYSLHDCSSAFGRQPDCLVGQREAGTGVNIGELYLFAQVPNPSTPWFRSPVLQLVV